VLDSLCQGEGLSGTVGPNDEDRGQLDRNGCGDCKNGLFLLSIQTGIQLLIPLPEGRGKMETLLDMKAWSLPLYSFANGIVLP